jgi:hypothetical protein
MRRRPGTVRFPTRPNLGEGSTPSVESLALIDTYRTQNYSSNVVLILCYRDS